MRVQFVGSGDAFGSGGRFQACLSIRSRQSHLLLDCGSTSLVALRQQGIDPSSVDGVLVSHLHADHYGRLPFLILDGQFRRGDRPLLIAGPPGLRDRLAALMEASFPGSSSVQRKFETWFLEIPERRETGLLDFLVTAYTVPHPSGAPAYALRLSADGKTLAYSGDGAWSDALPEVARGADLFVCEAYYWQKPIPHHLTYAALREHRSALDCHRLVLTHMSEEMLAHLHEVEEEVAADGLVLTL